MGLRMRDLGETFERAAVLYGRNFIVLVGVVAVATVPLALLQYPIDRIEQPELDAMLRLFAHPEIARTQAVPPLFASPRFLALIAGAALAGYSVWAFSLSAIAAGVERLYIGEPIGFRACWGPVVRRCASIAAVLGLAVLALILADGVVIAVAAVAVWVVVALAAPLVPAVAPAAIVFALAVTTIAPALLMMPCIFAFYAVAVESDAAIFAARVSLERIFTRAEFGRSLAYATAVSLIAFGSSFLVETAGVLGLERWRLAYAALDAAARTLVVPFVGVVLALYYFDVRIRREGFDIERGLKRVPAAGEPVYAPTAYLSGEERILIARFLERREEFSPRYRFSLARQLAAPARPRVPPELARLDDESLLERL
jgi:hypothetical protein